MLPFFIYSLEKFHKIPNIIFTNLKFICFEHLINSYLGIL